MDVETPPVKLVQHCVRCKKEVEPDEMKWACLCKKCGAAWSKSKKNWTQFVKEKN